jgi:hypothetical protein
MSSRVRDAPNDSVSALGAAANAEGGTSAGDTTWGEMLGSVWRALCVESDGAGASRRLLVKEACT